MSRAIRYGARLLALAWAGWWTFFGLASGIGEGLSGYAILLHAATPGLLFLLTGLLACRHERLGGGLLLLEGLLVLVAYPLLFSRMPSGTTLFVLLTMAVPPLLAGVVFLVDRQPLRPVH